LDKAHEHGANSRFAPPNPILNRTDNCQITALFAEKRRGGNLAIRLECIVMKLEEIAAEASKLSEEERASLASRLLHGLETPVYWVSDEEVDRRMREADADPSVLITFDELVAGLRTRGS
jgi:hypothetical protein